MTSSSAIAEDHQRVCGQGAAGSKDSTQPTRQAGSAPLSFTTFGRLTRVGVDLQRERERLNYLKRAQYGVVNCFGVRTTILIQVVRGIYLWARRGLRRKVLDFRAFTIPISLIT